MQSRILPALLAAGLCLGGVGCSSSTSSDRESQASAPGSQSASGQPSHNQTSPGQQSSGQQSPGQQGSGTGTEDAVASMAAMVTCEDYNQFHTERKDMLIKLIAKSKGIELTDAKVADIRRVGDMTCADPINKDKKLIDLAEQVR